MSDWAFRGVWILALLFHESASFALTMGIYEIEV